MEDDNIEKEIQENAKVMNLESLITGGIDAVIPITINYMGQDFSANIRPINAIENNEVTQKYINKRESVILNTVKKCLLKDDGKNYTIAELEKIPVGVIQNIYNKIQEISGIENTTSEDDMKMIRELMGF
ncbi:MAG: hypothetical protein MR352_00030 [Ruminococcus sp.]|nr:hypothetical protein [Ruminococcus sp.]MCI5616453.1 hypothetical protein [Ruminococcus sp.]